MEKLRHGKIAWLRGDDDSVLKLRMESGGIPWNVLPLVSSLHALRGQGSSSLCTSMYQSGLLGSHMLCISAIQKTSSFSFLQLYLPSMLQKNVMTGNYQANYL